MDDKEIFGCRLTADEARRWREFKRAAHALESFVRFGGLTVIYNQNRPVKYRLLRELEATDSGDAPQSI
jgi:hypothetical protein